MRRQCILFIAQCVFSACMATAQENGSGGDEWVIPLAAPSETVSLLSGNVDVVRSLGVGVTPLGVAQNRAPAKSIVQLQIVPVSIPLRPLLAVSVGTFTGGTFTHARLRLEKSSFPPADGIYDFVLEGYYTSSPILLLQIIPAYSLLNPPAGAKGIRVKAAEGNAVTAMLPHPWVGKRLVRKGETYSGPASTILEESITQEYLVFTPTDTEAPDRMIKKGRLQIHINADNVITSVVEG